MHKNALNWAIEAPDLSDKPKERKIGAGLPREDTEMSITTKTNILPIQTA
jgi:hypothetical protein